MLGHTDKVCPDLFELEADEGVRNWGLDLKPAATRFGSAATNKWLQDPIPSDVPRQTASVTMPSAGRNSYTSGAAHAVAFNDRMLAVDNQISALKDDLLASQTLAKAKYDAGTNPNCHVQFLHSVSTGTSASNLIAGRPLVLGLPAVPFPTADSEESQDATGSELKKRKRMLALQNGEATSFVADGVEGNFVIGSNVSHGGMLI